ncbi:MAG: carboxypeptidase regulatory-like domain-containing protein [Planctomycetota bacterium]|nr:MAG: carboxypeptidase regulatory-like domain-containing protein [Planctomycetota bacterium]
MDSLLLAVLLCAGQSPEPAGTPEAISEPLPAASAFVGWKGQVLDPEGAPVAGAHIIAGAGLQRQVSTTSDATGRFELAWPEAWGWRHDDILLAHLDHQIEWAPGRSEDEPRAGGRRVQLQMQKALAFPVRTLSSSGAPLPGVELVLEHPGRGILDRRTVDADGRAILRAPGRGIYELRPSGHGRARPEGGLTRWLSSDQPLEEQILTCQPWPQARPWPVVEAGNSKPLEASLVKWTPLGPPGPARFLVEAEGYLPRAVLLKVAPEKMPALALAPVPGVAVEGLPTTAGSEKLRLHWSYPLRWEYFPIDRGRQLPLPPAIAEGHNEVGPQGQAQLPLNPRALPKSLKLELRDQAGRLLHRWPRLNPARLGRPPWKLTPAPLPQGRWQVQLVDAEGNPVSGAWIEGRALPALDSDPLIRAAAVRRIDREAIADRVAARARTGADGRCELPLLAPTRWSWRVHRQMQAEGSDVSWQEFEGRPGLSLQPGEAQALRIEIPQVRGPEGRIRGRVLRADGHPARGDLVTAVLAQPLAGQQSRQASTWLNDQGEFLFSDLAPGPYRLQVRSPAAGEGLECETGGEAVEIRLQSTRVVRIEVVEAETGQPLPNCTLILRDPQSHAFPGLGPDGRVDVEVPLRQPSALYALQEGRAPTVFPLPEIETHPPGTPVDARLQVAEGRVVRVKFIHRNGQPAYSVYRVRWLDPPDATWFGEDSYFVREDFSWGLCTWPQAPRSAFKLQAYDDSGEALGPPVEIPAGEKNFGLRQVVPPRR